MHLRTKSTLLVRPLVGLAALVSLAAAAPAGAGAPSAAPHHGDQRLVVRTDSTAVDGPCDAVACAVTLADGRFRGTPVGTGALTASIRLRIADGFSNGDGGACAPLRARVVLDTTAGRLVLALSGDSCQDGGGPLADAAFTGVARFTIKRATGRYAGAAGSGLATLSEDAANHHRMTLVGRIARRGGSS